MVVKLQLLEIVENGCNSPVQNYRVCRITVNYVIENEKLSIVFMLIEPNQNIAADIIQLFRGCWRIFYMHPEPDLWATVEQCEQDFDIHFPYYRRLAKK